MNNHFIEGKNDEDMREIPIKSTNNLILFPNGMEFLENKSMSNHQFMPNSSSTFDVYYQRFQREFQLQNGLLFQANNLESTSTATKLPLLSRPGYSEPNLLGTINFLNLTYPTTNNNSNQFVDEAGTLIFPPCGDEIEDVNMIDDDCVIVDDEAVGKNCGNSEEVSFLLLDDMLNQQAIENTVPFEKRKFPITVDRDEQDYWKNTRDCDYRFSEMKANVINNQKITQNEIFPTSKHNENHQSFDSDVTESPLSPQNSKHLSRKKRKKLEKQRKGIDLTRPSPKIIPLEPIHQRNSKLIDDDSVDCENIDELGVDDLMSYYYKLKEELTILNIQDKKCSKKKQEISTFKDSDLLLDDFDQISDEEEPILERNLSQQSTSVISEVDQDENNQQSASSNNVVSTSTIFEDNHQIVQQSTTIVSNTIQLNSSIDNESKKENIPYNVIGPDQSTEQQKDNANNTVPIFNKDQLDKQQKLLNDEYNLREKLLRIMLEKQMNSESQTKSLPNTTETISSFVPDKQEENVPKLDLSQYNLIIHISDSESDSCEEQSLLEASSFQSRPSRCVISKLSKNQQREYEKLKQEIERRESIQNKRQNLKIYENRLTSTMTQIKNKKKKFGELNGKSLTLKKIMKKTKAKIDKLKRMLLMAQKRFKMDSVELQLTLKEMENVRESLVKDNENYDRLKILCTKVGNRLYGNDYSLPIAQNEKQQIVKPTLPKNHHQVNNKINDDKIKSNQISLKNLRNRMQCLLNSTYSSQCVMHLEHSVNFNFSMFDYSQFLQPNSSFVPSLPFSEFTERSSELLDQDLLKQYPTLVKDDNFSSENHQSVLMHFNSYRFVHQKDAIENCYSHSLNPHETLCHFDLTGSCNDPQCRFQHQKDYIFNEDVEKLLDLLTYSNEFASLINMEEFQKNPKLLREKLDVYLKSKQLSLDTDSFSKIFDQVFQHVMNESKISTSSLMIRFFPKELIKWSLDQKPFNQKMQFQTKVPFEDQRFNFNVRGDLYELKSSLFMNFSRQNDPDLYIKNRFFAPEGVPITAQLESSLAEDPHNIEMWINLAYYHLAKMFQTDQREKHNLMEHCFDSALNVLTRALESNRNNSELYEHYLLFFVIKTELNENDDNDNNKQLPKIQEICRQILKNCSTYRLWILHLNLCYSYEEKLSISAKIIEEFVQDRIQCTNDEEKSLNLMEIILNRMNLLLNQNKHEEAVRFFNSIFNCLEPSPNAICAMIQCKHRAFAWLCYIHLIRYRSLPYHCFQLTKRGCFLRLTNVEPIIFEWETNHSQIELRTMKRIFKRGLQNCCSSDPLKCRCLEVNRNPIETCFSLRLNLTNLNKKLINNIIQNGNDETIDGEDDDLENSYYLSFLFNGNHEVISHMNILFIFEIDLQLQPNRQGDLAINEKLNLIENSYNTKQDSKMNNIESTDEFIGLLGSQLKFNYWLAFYRYKLRNGQKAKETLRKNLTYYFNDQSILEMDDSSLDVDHHYQQLFEAILFGTIETTTNDSNSSFFKMDLIQSKLKFNRHSAYHKQVYLYLSYLLYIHVCQYDNVDQHYLQLERVFSSVLNTFSSSSTVNCQQAQNGLKILWFNYFLLLLDFPYSDSHFKIIYENLRQISWNFNSTDPLFVYHLINSISKFICTQDRLNFFVDQCKLNPENLNLVLKAFNMALELRKKETLWNLINYIIFEKKIRPQCLSFWKIAISLSVERNDHLNAHKFFQLAISLMPYNLSLLEMFENYETSINHQEHLDQLKTFVKKTLRLTTMTKNLEILLPS